MHAIVKSPERTYAIRYAVGVANFPKPVAAFELDELPTLGHRRSLVCGLGVPEKVHMG